MVVCVSGGRNLDNEILVFKWLNYLHGTSIGHPRHTLSQIQHGLDLPPGPISQIWQGGAPGADALAIKWAKANDVEIQTMCADWRRYGKKAGPIRNQQMIDRCGADILLAFPTGGPGTADCIGRAKAAGIPVLEIEDGQTSAFCE